MSHSGDILDRQLRDVRIKEHEGEDLNIRVWALLQIPAFIEKIGWIEHTNDWDLNFEVTNIDGQVYFSTEITPLNSKVEPYTEENGVNDLIVSLRLEDWWTDNDGSNDEPITMELSNIDRIYYG